MTNFEQLADNVVALASEAELADHPRVQALIKEAQRLLDFYSTHRQTTQLHALLRRQAS